MPRLLILGLGYSAARLAARLRADAWSIAGVRREAGGEALAFDDPAVADEIARATHILSSVPPDGGNDPVLRRYARAIRASGAAWIGYLSSTGVYGDAGGAWVDEGMPVAAGRRAGRIAADLGWQALDPRVHVFRLPGIYGPGRSALDRAAAFRVDAPGHLFSRIHVDDIAGAVRLSMLRPRPGVYNLADDLPATGAAVIDRACDLLGRPRPPLLPLAEAPLSPAARAFYSERRRAANGRMKRCLGYRLRYPDYRAGLAACLKESCG